MAEHDAFGERRKQHEEDYFRKKDRELIEKMRESAARDQARRDLSARTGLNDQELVRDLEELGFTPETVVLLPLVPIVQMAWAEGGVSPAERSLLLKVARARGITEGSPADSQLSTWMTVRPSSDVFTKATRLIRAMLAAGSKDTESLTADDLIQHAESIAAASGGLFGLGRISSEEREILAKIAEELKRRT
jgi:hypothetical protein